MAGAKPLHLRCALIWERTVIDDRAFRPGCSITAGDSSRSDFTLRSRALGKKHRLFRCGRSGATLRLKGGMLGRIRQHGQVHAVEELLAAEGFAEPAAGGAVEVQLTEGDGGVLVFGRVGLMFEFVHNLGKVEPARAGEVLGVDRLVSRLFGGGIVLAILFLLVSKLFAASDEGFRVEQLPERFVSFVAEDPESARELKEEMQRLQQKREEQERKRKEQPEPKPTSKPTMAPERTPETPEDAERERIREKVATKGVVGALARARKSSGALADVMGEGGLGISLDSAVRALDRGAQARVITSAGEGGIAMPSLLGRRGSSEALGEGLSAEEPATGRTGRRIAGTSRLAERAEARVELSVAGEDASITGGTLTKKQIADVVQKNKGAIRYCYEAQLSRFPTLRGRVVVDFIIEANGSVRTVRVPENGLSQSQAREKVASCLIRFIRRWRFPTPQGGKVRVVYPFTFGRAG